MLLEFRTYLPFSLGDYEVAYRYTAAKSKLVETGNNRGFEVITPPEMLQHPVYGECLSTNYVLHAREHLPRMFASIIPTGAGEVQVVKIERFPEIFTQIKEMKFMKENFSLIAKEITEADRIINNNIFSLPENELANRDIRHIDILDPYIPDTDKRLTPNLECFAPNARGGKTLSSNWKEEEDNVLINYRLYHILFQWYGMADIGLKMIERALYRSIHVFYRRMYYWMDEWYGMSFKQIRAYEAKLKERLNELRLQPEFSGMEFNNG